MKRSEMQKRLAKFLLESNPELAYPSGFSDSILRFLQSEGMLPPNAPSYTREGQLWNYMPHWEEEDETK